MIAPEGPSGWKYKGKECRQWILLKHMKGVVIKGYGTINGRGNTWWHLSCKNNRRVYFFFYYLYFFNFFQKKDIHIFLIFNIRLNFQLYLSLAGLWEETNCK